MFKYMCTTCFTSTDTWLSFFLANADNPVVENNDYCGVGSQLSYTKPATHTTCNTYDLQQGTE